MVLAGPDVLHRALAGGDEIDGMDDRAELPQRVLHARIVDRRPLDRDLDALRLLVDFVQSARDPVEDAGETDSYSDQAHDEANERGPSAELGQDEPEDPNRNAGHCHRCSAPHNIAEKSIRAWQTRTCAS